MKISNSDEKNFILYFNSMAIPIIISVDDKIIANGRARDPRNPKLNALK
jgi:hypothetical protein